MSMIRNIRAGWAVTKFVGRYVGGRPLDAVPRTDARFFARGTQALSRTGHASRWAYLPGWQRSAWRVGAPFTAMVTTWGYLESPELTIGGMSALTAVSTTVGVRRARRTARVRHVNAEVINPIALTLGPLLQQDPRRAGEWLELPPTLLLAEEDNATVGDKVALPSWVPTPEWVVRRAARTARTVEPDEGRIFFPPHLLVTDELQKSVTKTLAMKLGGDDWMITWHGRGSTPYIAVKARPQAPKMVTFDDLKPHLDAAKESAPILGMSAKGPVVIDLDTDAPHVALSCGSGAGKSVLLRGLIAQWLHNGTQVVILDGKRVSQSWAKDIPGVRYCRTGEQIHHALMEISAEVNRRFDLIDAVPAEQEDTVDVGRRMVVIFEEQNIGMQFLGEYWSQIKEPGDAKRSDAMRALDYILCAGRQARVHVVSVAQMFTVQASGGNPAARENYGIRVLARATRNAWMMLAPECAPFPKSSKRRGRMHLAYAGDYEELQTGFWTVREAREWAASGAAPTVPAEWSTGEGVTPPFTTSEQGGNSVTAPAPDVLTLSEIVRRGIIPMTYGALRTAKTRAGKTFPSPVPGEGETQYLVSEVEAWFTARENAKKVGGKA